MTSENFKTLKKITNIATAVLLIITLTLLGVMIVTRIQGKTPQLFGYQILRISSGSMEPKLHVGDIIISQSVDNPISLKAGDIVTYHGNFGSYDGKLITHEVVSLPYAQNGKVYLQTMGIANGYIDPEISEDQLVGKMVCKAPVLSVIFNFFMTPWGLAVVLIFLAFLFINEVYYLKKQIALSKEEKHNTL